MSKMNANKLLAIDPIRAKYVKKIQNLISDAKAGTVPKQLIEKLERIKNDYAEGKIVTFGELRKEILILASTVEAKFLLENDTTSKRTIRVTIINDCDVYEEAL